MSSHCKASMTTSVTSRRGLRTGPRQQERSAAAVPSQQRLPRGDSGFQNACVPWSDTVAHRDQQSRWLRVLAGAGAAGGGRGGRHHACDATVMRTVSASGPRLRAFRC